jgi:glycosyltransferase involved in cell wall biosynthesis
MSQHDDQNVEIVVVDNSVDGTAEIITREFPNVKLVRCAEDRLMPELWETGIRECVGNVVAITTSHFVPAKNWIAEILKAHENPSPAIGGAIENERTSGIVAWAVYFCRYSPYMLPFKEASVRDFAGDNASYKRSALERYEHAWRNGFWESFVHEEMIKDGAQLLVSPEIVVYHQKSFDLADFVKQRFWHGRQFGSERALSLSPLKRVLYILLSPLIPLVYLFRITRRVLSKRRHFGRYLLAFPVLLA